MTARGALSGEATFAWIRDLVGFGCRRTGTAAARSAAEYVADHFRSVGLERSWVDRVDSYRWEATEWSLMSGGGNVPCFPVSHSFVEGYDEVQFTTPEGGLSAPLIDLGDAGPEEIDDRVRGRIALFDLRFPPRDARAFYAAADLVVDQAGTMTSREFVRDPYHSNQAAMTAALASRGAVGFIGALSDYFESDRYINEDYGAMPMPGLWVSRAATAELRDRKPRSATMTLRGHRRFADGYTAIGVLPGRSPEAIVIESHHDSVWDGAVEDASGCAVVMALAQHFAGVPESERERTLIFASFDTHFTGYEAHRKFVAEHIERNQDGREVVACVAVEHIAREASVEDGRLVVGDRPEPRVIFHNIGSDPLEGVRSAVLEGGLDRIAIVPTAALPSDELPSDADFIWRAGVPVVSMVCGPMYLYDEVDTLDKVARDELEPVTVVLADVVKRLSAAPRATLAAGSP